jgi:hypothetical protein
VGQKALINIKYGNPDKDQLGSAAADSVGSVVYDVSVGNGTTPTPFSGVLDIFSEFVWLPCPAPPVPAFSHVPCASPACLSLLNITADDCGSMSSDDCEYIVTYGPEKNTTGYLSEETFTVPETEPVVAAPVVFGCSTATSETLDEGKSGVIGFGRGPYSLVSQLNASKFSYFLAPDNGNSSDTEIVVLLGDAALPQTSRSRSTPLLQSAAYPDLYYVNLTGIQVDGKALDGIPKGTFDLAPGGGSGGVVMSTSSAVTFLQPAAYAAVRRSLVSKINSTAVDGSAFSDGGFDLCYDARSVAALTFPKLMLVFGGEEGDAPPPTMELTTVHYFYKDNRTGLECLTLLPTPASTPFGSILGTLLQTGTNMIYDVGGGRLTLEKAAAARAGNQLPLVVTASLLLAWVLLF